MTYSANAPVTTIHDMSCNHTSQHAYDMHFGLPVMAMHCPTQCSSAGDLAIQLPFAHKEHSAGMGSPNTVHLWSSKRLRGVVPDL